MKTKVLISIGVVAITAFSFTFASSGSKAVKENNVEIKTEEVKTSAPIGGFIMEERIEP